MQVDVGVWLIVVTEYNIRGVRDGVVLHPLVHGSLASVAATFSRNTRGAKYCIKEGDEGLNSGIVSSGMELQSMGAVHKVAIARSHKGMSERFGDSAAGGAASYVALHSPTSTPTTLPPYRSALADMARCPMLTSTRLNPLRLTTMLLTTEALQPYGIT